MTLRGIRRRNEECASALPDPPEFVREAIAYLAMPPFNGGATKPAYDPNSPYTPPDDLNPFQYLQRHGIAAGEDQLPANPAEALRLRQAEESRKAAREYP